MEVFGDHPSKEIFKDEELAWEVFLQGLDVTSGKLVNGARNEYENPSTNITRGTRKSHFFHGV